MTKFFWTLILFALTDIATGQRCATDSYVSRFAPNVGTNTVLRQNGAFAGRDTLANEVIVVPVVVHVLYNKSSQNIPDERIIAQIEALNRDFRRRNADTVNTPAPFKGVAADARIVFCLAKVDPQGYKTTGIIRKYTKEPLFLADDQMKFSGKGGDDAWDATRYLNIWVCDLFGRTLGYATLPGGNPKVDGIVIQYGVFGDENSLSGRYNKGRTLTHETGHWLGLKHIWGDAEGGPCASDDIDDTPPQTGSNSGCSIFPKMSTCSINPFGDMFMNFMDFSDDACMNLFTRGQAVRMRSQFAQGGPRNSFLDSDLCDGSGAQEAPPAAAENATIRVYPNPVAEQLFIEYEPGAAGRTTMISLYNAQGKLVFSKGIARNKETVSMAAFPDGLYILVMGDGSDKKTIKVLKQSGGSRH